MFGLPRVKSRRRRLSSRVEVNRPSERKPSAVKCYRREGQIRVGVGTVGGDQCRAAEGASVTPAALLRKTPSELMKNMNAEHCAQKRWH